MWKPLWLAIQFLTRLPAPSSATPEPRDIGRSLLAYPVVGGGIGLLLTAISTLLQASDTLLIAALLLTVWVLITGALHLDGLADSADAWIGGHGDRMRTLEIMKDPRSGPVGVTAVTLLLMLKLASLNVVLQSSQWQALLLAPMLARGAVPLLFATTEYVRIGGLAETMVAHLPRHQLIHMIWPVVILTVWLLGWVGVWLLIFLIVVVVILRNRLIHRIGGTTGDTTGAVVEIVEVAVLLFFALQFSH